MKGLEAVEINLRICKSIIDFRIDANTFKKDYLLSDQIIKSKRPQTIESISKSVHNFGAYSLCNFINYTDKGIPFLMTENVRHNYIDWNIKKYVDKESHDLLYKSHCKKGQVLVTMAGEYLGRVAVYDKNEVCSSNQAIAKITVSKNVNPYVVSTFLNSKHGQNQINRFKTITGQPNINMSLIKSLFIPFFSDEISDQIESIIKQSEQYKLSTNSSYLKAESLLLETMGLKDFKPSKEPVNIKSFKESFASSGRLDAEYYQKKYENYKNLVISQEYTFVKDEYIHVTTNSKKDKIGYNYIEIGDVNVGDGSNKSNYILADDLPANAKTIVEKGDILISNVRPYRGAVTIINTNKKDLIVSGAFTVLRKNQKSIFNNEVLKVLLRSNIYKDWLLKFNVGTSYPVIKDEDVLNLPIPIVTFDKQEKIAELVKETCTLKKQSEQLLDLAKTAVEKAIEENEEIALQYIKNSLLLMDETSI